MLDHQAPGPAAMATQSQSAATAVDDLDLLDLGVLLWRQRGTVLLVTALTVALAAVYAFILAKPVYESEARLRPAAPGSLEALATPGSAVNLALEPSEVFQRIAEQLSALETRRQALERAQQSLGEGSPGEKPALSASGVSVDLESPVQGGDSAERLILRFRGPDPQAVTTVVEALLEEAQARTARELQTQRTALLESRLEALRNELAANIETARLDAAHRAARLRAAIATAASLGLEDPVPLASLSPEPKNEDSLYLRGSRFLRAELAALQQLAEADPNASLDGTIVDIRPDQRPTGAFLPYARRAASLQVDIEQLQALMKRPIGNLALARVDQPATVPEAPIAPRRGRILAIAVVVGVVLGAMAALLRAAILARFAEAGSSPGAEHESQGHQANST